MRLARLHGEHGGQPAGHDEHQSEVPKIIPTPAPAKAPAAPATAAPSTPTTTPTVQPGLNRGSDRRGSGQRRTHRTATRHSAARRQAARRSGSTLAARQRAGGAKPSAARAKARAKAHRARGAAQRRAASHRAPAGKGHDEGNGSRVTRTVRDIVEVVSKPVKTLLGALAVLSLVLGSGYFLTATRARRLARQRADLLQEVGLLQTALLPPVPSTVGAVRTSVAYRPSDGPGAGGDFYDALTLPGGRAAFILGDVSGHGRQALARTAFLRYTLRAYLEAGLEPRVALQVAGRVIDDHLGGDFATVVLAVHDPSTGSLTYACAGHPAPIVVGPTRPEPVLAASSPPIGLGMRTGVRQTTVPLPSGSVVCLYTDGLAEARTAEGILGRPRLADIVGELGRDATAARLLDRVADEARLVTDDMATVVLTPTAGVTAGGFGSEQLEVDATELEDGLAERFLDACGMEGDQAREPLREARSVAQAHGGAVLHVTFGIRGPQAEVVPRNVASLEAASSLVASNQ